MTFVSDLKSRCTSITDKGQARSKTGAAQASLGIEMGGRAAKAWLCRPFLSGLSRRSDSVLRLPIGIENGLSLGQIHPRFSMREKKRVGKSQPVSFSRFSLRLGAVGVSQGHLPHQRRLPCLQFHSSRARGGRDAGACVGEAPRYGLLAFLKLPGLVEPRCH